VGGWGGRVRVDGEVDGDRLGWGMWFRCGGGRPGYWVDCGHVKGEDTKSA